MFGMSPDVGTIAFVSGDGRSLSYSEKTAELIDSEVKRIIDGAYQKTMDLLTLHKADIEKVIY